MDIQTKLMDIQTDGQTNGHIQTNIPTLNIDAQCASVPMPIPKCM